MAVAMAFANFLLHSRAKVVVNQPFSFCLDTNQLHILYKERTWRLSPYGTKIIPRASPATTMEDEGYNDSDTIPTPKVIIDQDSDPDATVVEITFGDRLGALLDTMNALKNLGLNVVKANVFLDSSGKHNKFAITKADTGRKVEDPELLEAIRLTIINNLLQYHPESSSQLALGVAFGVEPPKQQVSLLVILFNLLHFEVLVFLQF
uniref:ACT domain-containing protein ACR n=1 Tax=Manihot esculenta TaxID=3983 RepID=A0A2C9U8W5_MANES